MGFLLLWFTTVVSSGVMEVTTSFQVMKDVADSGYKIDMKRISEFTDQMNSDISRMAITCLFIPFLNIIAAMKHAMDYSNNRPVFIDQFSCIDALEEMTEEEKKEYQKRPTGFHALSIFAKSEMRKEDASTIKLHKDSRDRDVAFERNSEEEERTLSSNEKQLEQLKALKQEIQDFKKHLDDKEEEKANPYIKK